MITVAGLRAMNGRRYMTGSTPYCGLNKRHPLSLRFRAREGKSRLKGSFLIIFASEMPEVCLRADFFVRARSIARARIATAGEMRRIRLSEWRVTERTQEKNAK